MILPTKEIRRDDKDTYKTLSSFAKENRRSFCFLRLQHTPRRDFTDNSPMPGTRCQFMDNPPTNPSGRRKSIDTHRHFATLSDTSSTLADTLSTVHRQSTDKSVRRFQTPSTLTDTLQNSLTLAEKVKMGPAPLANVNLSIDTLLDV